MLTGFVIFLCKWPIADASGTPASVLSFCTWLFKAAEDLKFDPILVAFNAAYRGLISLESHNSGQLLLRFQKAESSEQTGRTIPIQHHTKLTTAYTSL